MLTIVVQAMLRGTSDLGPLTRWMASQLHLKMFSCMISPKVFTGSIMNKWVFPSLVQLVEDVMERCIMAGHICHPVEGLL